MIELDDYYRMILFGKLYLVYDQSYTPKRNCSGRDRASPVFCSLSSATLFINKKQYSKNYHFVVSVKFYHI
ncbi:hypothetical protein B9Z55_013831 [Caenorhabditis nigoni]|uniref:Uncharacterized protein n=1 Tax=Caenorhabditis nigoni TaxID=1611254 RepID=A0A2G5U3F0_9PELO|nr:hypothetical protein B9Z55_013831 [Caenorhabditis nigoni]